VHSLRSFTRATKLQTFVSIVFFVFFVSSLLA